MTIDWLPGIVQLRATESGGTQNLSYPPRLVLHTTEGGGTVASLAAFYHGSTYWPHFTADLLRKELAQHLPFSQGARALSHTTATETNNAHCIQVEIIGRASESHGWPADQVVWLGHALAPVLDALGIHRSGPTFVAGGAGLNAPQRMSEAAWRAFNGVCGHQHVPENDHWDPGAFDLATFLAATSGAPAPPPIKPVPVPPPTSRTITWQGAAAMQTDLSMQLGTNGDGYKDLAGVDSANVHAVTHVGLDDPKVKGWGTQACTRVGVVAHSMPARIRVEGGHPGQLVTIRAVHD